MIITNLEKKLGSINIDIPRLEFEKGKIHGLLGGNGCGKSSLAKIIVGEMETEKGLIDLEGTERSKLTLMSQRPYMLQRTVYENIIYPLQIKKMEINEAEIDSMLDRIGLFDKKNQYARSLSSGQQQKLSFLRALIFKPEIIIVDETLSNLDPESLSYFEKWILDWQSKEKVTWIIISHQLVQINNLCDTVHFMKEGKILVSGEKNKVLFESGSDEIEKYIQYQIISGKK